MDEAILILFIIAGAVLLMPLIALLKASHASKSVRENRAELLKLEARTLVLERELQFLKEQFPGSEQAIDLTASVAPAEKSNASNEIVDEVAGSAPPQAIRASQSPEPVAPPRPQESAKPRSSPASDTPPSTQQNKVSLEQFMGVKLFAWLGGLAMFLGVIFFVKYAFDRDLIPPALRVALGFITGAGLLTGGLWTLCRRNFQVLAQSLCGTGVLILYGVSFAAHAVYHFPAFSSPMTFGLMSLITLVAFLIAVRFNALVVAVMGMIGGFLNPVLLPSVQDHVFALFSYIALLDVGLLMVARHRNWGFLTLAAAIGTALIQVSWFVRYFVAEEYFIGNATLIPMGVLLFFVGIFVAGAWRIRACRPSDLCPSLAALVLIVASMIYAFIFLAFSGIAQRPFLLYGFVFVLNASALLVTTISPRLTIIQVITTFTTYIHLAVWTTFWLSPELLGNGLVLYLVFGVIHVCYPIVQQKLPGQADPMNHMLGPWFIPLALVLMLLAVLVLPDVSLLVWPAILVADLLVIAFAYRANVIAPVITALILTLVTAGAWLLQAPMVIGALLPLLTVVVGFGSLFTVAGILLGRRTASLQSDPDSKSLLVPATLLPLLSGTLPFMLLVLCIAVLPVINPSPIFGVALLLASLLLGLSILARLPLLVPLALLCTMAVELVWHDTHFNPESPGIALTWYLIFYGVFTAFPFVFAKAFRKQVWPWAASALSGLGHFLLIHNLIARSFPNGMMGLLPIAFAVPMLFALFAAMRGSPSDGEFRKSRIAWFGGTSLLFITLVFPIQFDRQWLTLSWALEGAALIWLFRRVRHSGLKAIGAALLTTAFIRLAINPAVFSDYGRSGTAIFNWHFYIYGVVASAQLLAGRWLPMGDSQIRGRNLRPLFYSFGGILLFLLLNIEIADFFTVPGERFITFSFGGNFARDMTYSIAWGLFSLVLLVLGIWMRVRALRYTAIALLVLTLLKLFIHDLSSIDSIYRIGALIGVAIIAFIASFLYQQFFNRVRRNDFRDDGSETPDP